MHAATRGVRRGRRARTGHPGDRELTISNESRARIKGVFEPIALAMGRAGLTPDGLTLIGFAITVVGAVLGWLGALISTGRHLRRIEPRA